jgi:hypothetical protein
VATGREHGLAPISNRISSIGASNTKVKELAVQGIDADGESVKQAGKQAIDDNITRYTPSPALPDVRKAIDEKLKRDNTADSALGASSLGVWRQCLAVAPVSPASVKCEIQAILRLASPVQILLVTMNPRKVKRHTA